jgi:hypothetical protein
VNAAEGGYRQIVEQLILSLGNGAKERDLPADLRNLIREDIDNYQSLSSAIRGEKLRVVPVRWGGSDFEKLRVSIQDRLKGHADVSVDPVTDRYDVFEWADEFQPTIGLFPLYRLPDREQNWCIIRLGLQEKVCLALTNEAASTLCDRFDCTPLPNAEASRLVFSRQQFIDLIDHLRTNNIAARFITFGSGHAAPKILAQAVKSDFKALRYFVTNICYVDDIPLVQSHRTRRLLTFIDQHSDKNDPIRYIYENRIAFQKVKRLVSEATVVGLAEELGRSESTKYDFVVSDLGSAEFRELLNMGERVFGALEGPKREDALVVWEVEHDQEIPIGIGISKYGLVKTSHTDVLEIIHREIATWLDSMEKEKKLDILAAEYGLRIIVGPITMQEGKRAERQQFLIGKFNQLRDLMDSGTYGADQTEELQRLIGRLPDVLPDARVEALISIAESALKLWGDDGFYEKVSALIVALE